LQVSATVWPMLMRFAQGPALREILRLAITASRGLAHIRFPRLLCPRGTQSYNLYCPIG
jgi:hypothetical protein